jgi:hypothetical protein
MTLFGFPIASPAASVLLFAIGVLVLIGMARLYQTVAAQFRRVETAWWDVESALEQRDHLLQRDDRIPALAATLSASPNADTLPGAIRQARQQAKEAENRGERILAEQGISCLMASLLTETETADGRIPYDVADLRAEMRAREQYIAEARERYNEAAEGLNAYRRAFPAGLIVRALTPDPAPVFVPADAMLSPDA